MHPELKLFDSYTSVIVNFSTGIDSTGALRWALQNFSRETIWLLYCDTGLEYEINDNLAVKAAQHLGVKYVILRHPKGFIGILEERGRWPDSQNRWCTSYLKKDITEKWIRANRHLLGERCLFITGERRDESSRRAKLPEIQFHNTTLKTTRKGIFTCHWLRPVLNYEKGLMFEWGKKLGIPPHPCYEYLNRCSCFACVLMPSAHAAANMLRHPRYFHRLLQAEMRFGHKWKRDKGLVELWNETCEDAPLDHVV